MCTMHTWHHSCVGWIWNSHTNRIHHVWGWAGEVGGGGFSRDLLFLLNAAAAVQSERGILPTSRLSSVGGKEEIWTLKSRPQRQRSSSSSSGTSLRGKCSAVRRCDTRLSLHPQPAGLPATEHCHVVHPDEEKALQIPGSLRPGGAVVGSLRQRRSVL